MPVLQGRESLIHGSVETLDIDEQLRDDVPRLLRGLQVL